MTRRMREHMIRVAWRGLETFPGPIAVCQSIAALVISAIPEALENLPVNPTGTGRRDRNHLGDLSLKRETPAPLGNDREHRPMAVYRRVRGLETQLQTHRHRRLHPDQTSPSLP